MSENRIYALKYIGTGIELLKIILVNFLLTILTLGLYYPWARAKALKYHTNAIEFDGTRFDFHGTGKEMFFGFIKAIGLMLVLVAICAGFYLLLIQLGLLQTTAIMIAYLIFYVVILLVVPFSLYSSYKYILSRTTWRSIRFGFRGDLKPFVFSYFKWIFFTIITVGIYAPWFAVNLRKYFDGNTRLGNITASYSGSGKELLFLHLKGFFLTMITFGIYSFAYTKNIYNYHFNHFHAEKNGTKLHFNSKLSAMDVFVFTMLSALSFLTLFIATPWVITYTQTLIFQKAEISGDMNLDDVEQTEADYKNATGEGFAELLDIDVI